MSARLLTRSDTLAAARHAARNNDQVAASGWSREWIYFSLTIVAWCYTPLIRRLVDYRHGAYSSVQVASLIPFVLLLPLTVICFKRERLERLTGPLKVLAFVWLATLGYGFVVAAAFGSVSAGAFELVQYLVPMLGGIWLAGQDIPVVQSLRRFCLVLLPCAGVVAVYGVFQWVQPPPWDVMWVEGADFVSAGSPEPFAMRIFATLNSPGPAADFFVLTLLLTLPLLRLRSLWMWPLLASLGAALLLTLVREAWVGLLVGVAVYVLLSPRRFSTIPSLATYVALLVFLISSLPAVLGSGPSSDFITSRMTTLSDVGHDDSALTRQSEIGQALIQGLNNPLGAGLGAIGTAAKLGPNTQEAIGIVLDSGYLARLIELGWLGIVGYIFVVIGGPLIFAFRLLWPNTLIDRSAKVVGVTGIAMCAALAWGDAANDAHLGLDGFFFWIALGFASLALRSAAPKRVPANRPLLRRRII